MSVAGVMLALAGCGPSHARHTGGHVDTNGEAWCDDAAELPLQAASDGVTPGVVGVWLEAVEGEAAVVSHALDEVDYYEWVGAFPLAPWADCASAAAASWRLRFTIWDGRPDEIEDVALIVGSEG